MPRASRRFHAAARSPGVEQLTDDAVAVTFDVPDDLRDDYDVRRRASR